MAMLPLALVTATARYTPTRRVRDRGSDTQRCEAWWKAITRLKCFCSPKRVEMRTLWAFSEGGMCTPPVYRKPPASTLTRLVIR